MLEYAKSVGENRTHLEVLDAHLYAKNMGKKLAIAIDSPTVSEGEFLKVMSSSEFLQLVSEGSVAETIDPGMMNDTWAFLSCNALYDQSAASARNHWVPILFKSQVANSVWIEATDLATAQTKLQLRSHEVKLAQLEGDFDVEDCDDEVKLAQHMGLLDKTRRETIKFLEFLYFLYFPRHSNTLH